MCTLQKWLDLDEPEIADYVAQRVSTAALYLNGTRRWFLSQNQDWANYSRLTGTVHRQVSQLFYNHGIKTLIQPVLGYDLVGRGRDYIKLAVEQGLAELTTDDYRNWYHRTQIRVTFYGNWPVALADLGFAKFVNLLKDLMAETQHYTKHKLLLGIFADESLDKIVSLAQTVNKGEELLELYYGQPVGPVDLVVSSGQPAIWDIPLLDINKASLYFLQAPTFCLDQETLRRILFDHLCQRVNDDELYDNLMGQDWKDFDVLGIGQRTRKGWIAT